MFCNVPGKTTMRLVWPTVRGSRRRGLERTPAAYGSRLWSTKWLRRCVVLAGLCVSRSGLTTARQVTVPAGVAPVAAAEQNAQDMRCVAALPAFRELPLLTLRDRTGSRSFPYFAQHPSSASRSAVSEAPGAPSRRAASTVLRRPLTVCACQVQRHRSCAFRFGVERLPLRARWCGSLLSRGRAERTKPADGVCRGHLQ